MDSGYAHARAIPVAQADADVRAEFITKVYMHLFGAMIFFTVVEIFFFQSGFAEGMYNFAARTSWLLILGAFMIVGWLASKTAFQAQTPMGQYGAFAIYVIAEAVIFAPLLFLAYTYAPGVINSAAIVTLAGFACLTMIAFMTRKDFSFMGGALRWIGIMAIVLIVASLVFGFELGTFFSVAMIAFAGGAILYETSNILLHYPEDRYVGAALSLFASVALMFWYVLRIFLARD